MNLNDLLNSKRISPETVLVLRHRPWETQLNKVLPWLAADDPELFNAYQQTQGAKLEKVMQALRFTGSIASFIGLDAGKAVFVGLYSIGDPRPLTHRQYWNLPEYAKLHALGMTGYTDERRSILHFDLELTDFYSDWQGKLVIGWPAPERSWWRRAHRNTFPIQAILEESAFDAVMPEWTEIVLNLEQVRALPARWKAAMSQWRGIYYIRDKSDGRGYVGSAYGKDNLLGRWMDYVAQGHGGNRQLRRRNPKNFLFSILRRVSPDLEDSEVVDLESTWKTRLHTRSPDGLNDN
jgi:hypothetical protein